MYTLLFIYLVLGLGIAYIRIFGFRFIWRERVEDAGRGWLKLSMIQFSIIYYHEALILVMQNADRPSTTETVSISKLRLSTGSCHFEPSVILTTHASRQIDESITIADFFPPN